MIKYIFRGISSKCVNEDDLSSDLIESERIVPKITETESLEKRKWIKCITLKKRK